MSAAAPAEKAAITAACERLIAEVLRPRFLPEVRPSTFNYPVAIDGKWHGNKYRFFTRYRSDDPTSLAAEFDAPSPGWTMPAGTASILCGIGTRPMVARVRAPDPDGSPAAD